jgi:hypothetical protein
MTLESSVTIVIMFIIQATGAYPRVKLLKIASLRLAPALPVNITLGYKGLPGTNTLS